MKASIVINNYNYGRYLANAIDSALCQTHMETEVIVVDDGSTDNSVQVITGYGNRVLPVLKSNGGQGSAINAGFDASSGDFVIFLDSDDMLESYAVEYLEDVFSSEQPTKVQWRMEAIDATGTPLGFFEPRFQLRDGDLRSLAIEIGPLDTVSPPMSGNVWSRNFLEWALPMPEESYAIDADAYLIVLALIHGQIITSNETLSKYRLHGHNSSQITLDARLSRHAAMFEKRCAALKAGLARQGHDASIAHWRTVNPSERWRQRAMRVVDAVRRCVPEGSTFILVDEHELADSWGTEVVGGRYALPFLEKDGHYWGAPVDDREAIREIERLRCRGASFLAFAWPAFWWLDHYREFHRHLHTQYRCVLADPDTILFDMCLKGDRADDCSARNSEGRHYNL